MKLETARLIAIWYDYAVIENKTHVMFTFQIIYDKSTYICPPGMTERALQHEIETPQTYFIGLSSSTTEAERSFDDMRLGDVLSLSEKITINNITYDDKFRITFGDNPVRCSEAGQNKSGHYRLCSLPLLERCPSLASYDLVLQKVRRAVGKRPHRPENIVQ